MIRYYGLKIKATGELACISVYGETDDNYVAMLIPPDDFSTPYLIGAEQAAKDTISLRFLVGDSSLANPNLGRFKPEDLEVVEVALAYNKAKTP